MERSDTANNDNLAEMLLECLNDHTTLKDIHQIPDDMMNSLYAYAYQFYQQGKLDNAETFFQFLCMYDFYNTDYFMGLAAVYQLKKQYQKAADLYAVVFAMDGNDHRSVFYAGQCQLMLEESMKAHHCFELVSEHSNDAELLRKAHSYLNNMKVHEEPVPECDFQQL